MYTSTRIGFSGTVSVIQRKMIFHYLKSRDLVCMSRPEACLVKSVAMFTSCCLDGLWWLSVRQIVMAVMSLHVPVPMQSKIITPLVQPSGDIFNSCL